MGQSLKCSPAYYNAWSGWVSDLGEVTLIAGMVAAARHINCGHRGCWRPYRHITKDGHKLCKKHVQLPLSQLDLHEIHEDHR